MGLFKNEVLLGRIIAIVTPVAEKIVAKTLLRSGGLQKTRRNDLIHQSFSIGSGTAELVNTVNLSCCYFLA